MPKTKPAVLAIGAHPDDIEFMMAGTLILLREAGWALHYLNVANGSHGTAVDDHTTNVIKRTAESREACEVLGARYHESICNDLEVYHNYEMVAKVLAVVRTVRPRIVLTQSPQDYMEEHMNACRLAVTASFCRGMCNYLSMPPVPPVGDDVTVYHAMPYGLRGPMRERIHAGQYVDVTSTLAEKRRLLACHRSQKEWLDKSQGLDAYLETMEGFSREMGKVSKRFKHAEGWRRRSHLGFSATATDPLSTALGKKCLVNEEYERALDD
ncbi:MAG: LmbE family protein [Lentisphaerae bacterium RIFOXYB12_FULL_65_16]|nr:MAG: LmbE family protein [Lentisphaerae bacterium RIFOXYA12_64_32]OGV89781.1 MAG: LmbE family protein [Lentisphaerae bacterium RIFOXYB12_FULL_65_16]